MTKNDVLAYFLDDTFKFKSEYKDENGEESGIDMLEMLKVLLFITIDYDNKNSAFFHDFCEKAATLMISEQLPKETNKQELLQDVIAKKTSMSTI